MVTEEVLVKVTDEEVLAHVLDAFKKCVSNLEPLTVPVPCNITVAVDDAQSATPSLSITQEIIDSFRETVVRKVKLAKLRQKRAKNRIW